MILLCVIAIAFAVIAWAQRPLSLALLIVMLPVYQIRYSLFGIPFTLLEVCILILTAVWLIQMFIRHERIEVPYRWALLVFLIAGTIAMAVSVDIRAGLGLWKAYIIEPVFVFLVYINTIRTQKEQRYIHWSLIILLLYISAAAVMQSIGWMSIPEPYASEAPQRATSVYSFPTAIGKITDQLIAFSLVFIAFSMSSIYAGMRRRLFGFTLASVFGMLGLFVSVNRGALLGVAAGIFLLAFFSRRKAIVFSILGLACVGLLFVPAVQSQIQNVFSRTDTSTDVRVVMWQGTWRLIEHHPITGAGLGGFPVLYDQYRDASHVELFPNPDSLYLTLWSEMGLYGIFAFMWIFFLWIRGCIRALRGNQYGSLEWLLALGGLAALAAFLVHGIVDTPYFKNDLAVLFWVLFALVIQNERRLSHGSI